MIFHILTVVQWNHLVWIMLGGFLGQLLPYFVTRPLNLWLKDKIFKKWYVPWGTIVVNTVTIGVLSYLAEHFALNSIIFLVGGMGICATMSSCFLVNDPVLLQKHSSKKRKFRTVVLILGQFLLGWVAWWGGQII